MFEANPPDVAVVDVLMPGIDGYGVLRGMRASAHAGVPVVMMTATADDEQAWRAWSDGVDYFLPKPFDPDELLRFLAYLFKQQMVRALGS
jgi:two-component system OmpR family response regulator